MFILLVLQVTANDLDTVGGMVRYRLTDAVPFSAITQFSVNRTTGQITLLKALDRETDSAITLVVTASDMGEPGVNKIVAAEGNLVARERAPLCSDFHNQFL